MQNSPISAGKRTFCRLTRLGVLLLLTASSAFPGTLEALPASPSFQAVQNEAGNYVPTESPFEAGSPSAGEKERKDPWNFDELGRLTRLSPAEPEPGVVKAGTSAVQSYIKTAFSYFSAGANRNKAIEAKSGYPFEGYNSKGVHRYTQPTNIGFYALLLANLITGEVKSEHFSKEDAKSALLKMMKSLLSDQSKLGFKGLMPWMAFNGSSWRRDSGPEGRRVMFGDNANLSSALATAIGALSRDTLDKDTVVQSIKKKMKAFLSNQKAGYQFLYDSNEGQFHRGWNFSGKYWESGHHNYFGDEFRSGILFVMLEYGFPTTVYEGLDVQIEDYPMSNGTTVYTVAPYDGSASQMLWPALTLPEINHPALAKMLKGFVNLSLDFSKQRNLPGFLAASYTGIDRYSGSVGIAAIAVNSRNRNEKVASLYTLGAARMLEPKKVDSFLSKILKGHPDLKTSHGLWDGVDKNGRAIKEQTVASVTSFLLGLIGRGPQQMTRYLKDRGLYAALLQVWKSGGTADLIKDSTNSFTWGNAQGRKVSPYQYEITAPAFGTKAKAFTAWVQNNVNLSGRKLVIGYQSNMDLGNVKLEFKKCPQGNCSQEQRLALQINHLALKNTRGQEKSITIDLPPTPALSGIDEVVAVVSGGTGKSLKLTVSLRIL